MSENTGNDHQQPPQGPPQGNPPPPAPGPPPGPPPPGPDESTAARQPEHGQQPDQPPGVPPAQQPPAAPAPAPGAGPEPVGQHGPGAAEQQGAEAAAQASDQPREYARAPEVNISLPGFLKPMKRTHWLTLLGSQAVAYVSLLFFALLTVIALVVGLLLSGSDDIDAQVTAATGGMDLTPSVFIAFITLPFQVAATWLFGTFGFNIALHDSMTQMMPGGDNMGASVWAPDLLYVVLALLLSVWVGRIWLKRSRAVALYEVPRLARMIANLVLALLMAGLTLLVTWIFSYRESFSLADLAALEGAADSEVEEMADYMGVGGSETVVSMSGSAASGSLFLGAFLFYLLIGVLLSGNPRTFSRVKEKIDYFLPSASRIPRVLGAHSLIIVVPLLIFLAVYFTIDAGPAGAFSLPLWGFSAAIFSFVMLNMGAVTMSGSAAGFGQVDAGSETLFLWTADFAWWQVLLAILLGLLGVAVASVVWGLRRDSRDSTLRNLLSWLALPLTYGLVGVVLVLFGQIRGSADVLGAASIDFHIGPVWWTFMILLVVGVVVETLSRFLGPAARRKLPAGLRRVLGGPATGQK